MSDIKGKKGLFRETGGRRPSLRAVFLAITCLVVFFAPAARAVNRSSEKQSWVESAYSRGETLDFTLAWLRLVGGSARMTVTPSADGEELTISSVARSSGIFARIFKVRDEIESVVDRVTFSTLRYHKILNERDRHKEERTVVDESRGIAFRKGKEIEVPNPVFDPLSTVFYLRKLELTPGKKYSVTVLADGKVYVLEAEVLRRELARTDAGVFKTVVVEPKMRGGGLFGGENTRLLIWYTDDERHIPVRIRSDIPAGSITATLRSFKLGPPPPMRQAVGGANPR